MKWFLTLALVSILAVACAGAAPAYTPQPTVDVDATVDAAVEATKTVERAVERAVDARVEASRAAAPTATPVVMTVFAPTPEPYVAAPGSLEQGIEELYTCLQEIEEFRALLMAGMEQKGWSHEAAEVMSSALLEDKEYFSEVMLEGAEEDSEAAVMLSVFGSMPGGLCGDDSLGSGHDLGMTSSKARELIEEFYDCLAADEETGEYFLSDVGAVGRDVFVAVVMGYLREESDAAGELAQLEEHLNQDCR